MDPELVSVSLLLADLSKGSPDEQLARKSFYKSVRDPKFVISDPSSVRILREHFLLDDEEDKVHKATRDSYIAYNRATKKQ